MAIGWLGLASLCVAQAAAPSVAPEITRPVLDPTATPFPAPDLVDFSPTLDAPAGKQGCVFVGTDGRFYFEDGRRARFWGINVAKDSVFASHDVIDRVADRIASAGFNLVRLHHMDDVTGLLPPERAGQPERIEPAKLDAVHYWVSALKQRGVYVYLDLLDFRTFHEQEGVRAAAALGRGAKPVAVFNERLIELQVDYARELLFGHVNPYTGLALGADPAVALVELCDENGLFAKASRLDEMPEGYSRELERRWNFWLRSTYGGDEALARAWTGADGRSALAEGERLADSSVRLLPAAEPLPGFPSPTGEPLPPGGRAARDRDMMRFYHSVHREYFAQVRGALRQAGLRAPLTAVTDWDQPADLRAVVDELDFTACNWYYDHPVFAADRAWRLPSFFTNASPIADREGLDFSSSVLRAAVRGKPIVVREWGVCWPSKFRGAGLLEAAAYAAFQDLDGLILFTYNTDPDNTHIEYFDVSSDPVRWGLAAIAGRVYRDRAVGPAAKTALIACSRAASFGPEPEAEERLFRLGWASRLRRHFFEEACDEVGDDLLIAVDQGERAAYAGDRLLFVGGRAFSAAGLATLVASGYSPVPRPATEARYVFDGFVYNPGQALSLPPGFRFPTAELHPAGYEAVGVSEDGALATGFYDPARGSCILSEIGATAPLRAALDLLAEDDAQTAGHVACDRDVYVSDTGELARYLKDERLVINAPQAQGVVGALTADTVRTRDLEFSSASPIGVLMALSLDGKPLGQSDQYLVKMVTVAANHGEQKTVREAPPGSPRLKLEAFGTGPVATHGEPSSTPTTVSRGGKTLLSAFMLNGTFEAVRKGREGYLWCDTPGVRFSLPDLGANVRITAFPADGDASSSVGAQPFAYPQGCVFVKVETAGA